MGALCLRIRLQDVLEEREREKKGCWSRLKQSYTHNTEANIKCSTKCRWLVSFYTEQQCVMSKPTAARELVGSMGAAFFMVGIIKTVNIVN